MYVRRDANGRINGAFAALQPGFAEEWLEPDNPELQAFLNPPTRLVIELPDPTSVEERLNVLEQQFEDIATTAVTGALAVRMRRA